MSRTWSNFCPPKSGCPAISQLEHPKANFGTNPNNHSASGCNCGYQNYSHYECRRKPEAPNQFWVMGTRNPVCKIGSRPILPPDPCSNEVDNLYPTQPGYNRNGRFRSGILNA